MKYSNVWYHCNHSYVMSLRFMTTWRVCDITVYYCFVKASDIVFDSNISASYPWTSENLHWSRFEEPNRKGVPVELAVCARPSWLTFCMLTLKNVSLYAVMLLHRVLKDKKKQLLFYAFVFSIIYFLKPCNSCIYQCDCNVKLPTNNAPFADYSRSLPM